MEKRIAEKKIIAPIETKHEQVMSLRNEFKKVSDKQEEQISKSVGVAPVKNKKQLDKKRFMIYVSNTCMKQISKIAKSKGYSASEYFE
jgi:hypothetical protein